MKVVRLVLLFVLLFSASISLTQAQSTTLEFTHSRIDIEENETFTVEAIFTNTDLQDYDWFSLRGVGPDLGEHNWGIKTVDLHTYSLYTVSWLISLSDSGYYTLYVECGAFLGSVETLSDSMTVYVSALQEPSTFPQFLLFMITVIGVCGAVIIMKRRRLNRTPQVTPNYRIEERLRSIDREGYIEPNTRIILCPFCEAKNEPQSPQCWNCGAKM